MFYQIVRHKKVRYLAALAIIILWIIGTSLGLDIIQKTALTSSQDLNANFLRNDLFVQPVQAQTKTLQLFLPLVINGTSDDDPLSNLTATPSATLPSTPEATVSPTDSTLNLPTTSPTDATLNLPTTTPHPTITPTETASATTSPTVPLPTTAATITPTVTSLPTESATATATSTSTQTPSSTATSPPIATATSTATATMLPPTTPTATPSTNNLVLYDDNLHNGFQNWSWAPLDLANSNPVNAGSQSISVSYAGQYDGIWFVNPGGDVILPGKYKALQFDIHGGNVGGQQLSIKAGSDIEFPTNTVSLGDYLPNGPVAGAWRTVTIPLSELNLTDVTVANIAFQSDLPSAQSTFYIDDVIMVANDTPPDPISANIHVQRTNTAIPIDPLMFGSNLPAWLNPTRFSNQTFQARTIASGVTMLRMPGGSWSNSYNWLPCEKGIAVGVDPAYEPGCNWTWASRPTDFLDFLQAVDLPGIWAVNPNGTAQEAAALVAFFNAEVSDTTVIGVDARGRDWLTAGHWAQLRADNGNPDPYPILWWEVGNEVYGGKSGNHPECADWGWEEVWTCDGTEYVNGRANGTTPYDGYLAFQAAMKAVDPRIKVGAVGVEMAADYNNWGNEVLAGAGTQMDFYSIHQYAYFQPPDGYKQALARPHEVWEPLRADLDQALATNVNGRDIPAAITEFNMFAVQDQDNGRWMTRAVNALFLADTIGQMIQNGFMMAQHWNLSNGETAPNGTDYGLMTTGYARQPQYYVYPLWTRFGKEMLPHTSTVSAVDMLSIYTGRIDNDTISIIAINKTHQPINATITFDGNPTITGGIADIIQAESPAATTVTFNGDPSPPNDLSGTSTVLSGTDSPLDHTFAPYSITLLRLDIDVN